MRKMTENQFGAVLRSCMREMFREGDAKWAFAESSAFRHWNHAFRREHARRLGLPITEWVVVARDPSIFKKREAVFAELFDPL